MNQVYNSEVGKSLFLTLWSWANKKVPLTIQAIVFTSTTKTDSARLNGPLLKKEFTLNKLFFETFPSKSNTSSLSYKSYKRCFTNVVLPGVHGYPPPMCWAAAVSRSERQTKPISLLRPKSLTLQIPKYPQSMDFVNADFDEKSD